MKTNINLLKFLIILMCNSSLGAMAPAEEKYIQGAVYFSRIQQSPVRGFTTIGSIECWQGPKAFWSQTGTRQYQGSVLLTSSIGKCDELKKFHHEIYTDPYVTYVSYLDENKKVIAIMKIHINPIRHFTDAAFNEAVTSLLDPHAKARITNIKIAFAGHYPKEYQVSFYDKHADSLFDWKVKEKSEFDTLTAKGFIQVVEKLKKYFNLGDINPEEVQKAFKHLYLEFTDEDLKALHALIKSDQKGNAPAPKKLTGWESIIQELKAKMDAKEIKRIE